MKQKAAGFEATALRCEYAVIGVLLIRYEDLIRRLSDHFTFGVEFHVLHKATLHFLRKTFLLLTFLCESNHSL